MPDRNLTLLVQARHTPARAKVLLNRMVEIDDTPISSDGEQHCGYAVLYTAHVFDRVT